jgi:hypothetical protein
MNFPMVYCLQILDLTIVGIHFIKATSAYIFPGRNDKFYGIV